MASPSLTLIKKNLEALDMDADIFELVYEGFWDLYTFHPKCEDVSAKKLLAWIPKINLQVPEGTPEPVRNNDEEGEEAARCVVVWKLLDSISPNNDNNKLK